MEEVTSYNPEAEVPEDNLVGIDEDQILLWSAKHAQERRLQHRSRFSVRASNMHINRARVLTISPGHEGSISGEWDISSPDKSIISDFTAIRIELQAGWANVDDLTAAFEELLRHLERGFGRDREASAAI